MIKEALILAGGKGTRLLPYTLIFPKPMLPIGGFPILEIIVRQLIYFGYNKITISLGYMPEIIKSYFSNLKIPDDILINFVQESEPLGTAGPLSLLDHSQEDVLVINGDVLSTLNFNDMLEFHKKNTSDLTLAVREVEYKLPLGVIEFDISNRITSFKEKPVFKHYDNLGIYIYNKNINRHM